VNDSGRWRRVGLGTAVLAVVIAAGTIGYMALGLGFLDALYQTITTLTTVGFREVGSPTAAFRAFTIVLILVGVGATLYTVTALMETLLETRIDDTYRRRRMQRQIDEMRDHVIVCGYGQVGRSIVQIVRNNAKEVVVVDRDEARCHASGGAFVVGDATDDDVLQHAGIAHAATLVLATDNDVDNVYVALSARALRSDLFIVARASEAAAEPKLRQAGADRVVNPQHIGGMRMATTFLQPTVVEFIDVVMHDQELEVRLEELELHSGSELVDTHLDHAAVRERTGAVLLAVRPHGGRFITNPTDEKPLHEGDKIIALGTQEQLDKLRSLTGSR
jgi:voltage-gated potassium channel